MAKEIHIKESIHQINSPEGNLHGVLTQYAEEPNETILVLISGGLIHKIGPNRIYVKLAREFAEEGFDSFRFDLSGIGESIIENIKSELEVHINDIRCVVEYLSKSYKKIILVGLCSGANIIYNYLKNENSIAGFIGINGHYIDEYKHSEIESILQPKIQSRYYKKKLFSLQNWFRVLSGKSNYKGILRALNNKILGKRGTLEGNKIQFTTSLNQLNCKIPICLIYAEGSTGYDAYLKTIKDHIYQNKLDNCTIYLIRKADHIFTPVRCQNKLVATILLWLTTNG